MTLVFHSNAARARMEAAGRAFTEKKQKAAAAKPVLEPRPVASPEWEQRMADAAATAEDKLRTWKPWPTLDEILAGVVERTGIGRHEIMSRRRNFKVVAARHECFWLARERTTFSLPQIGRFFHRDHTTVLHGIRKYEATMQGEANGQASGT